MNTTFSEQITAIQKAREMVHVSYKEVSTLLANLDSALNDAVSTIASLNMTKDLTSQEKRIQELEEALKRVQKDINWMCNEGKLLNRFVFEYIDELLTK